LVTPSNSLLIEANLVAKTGLQKHEVEKVPPAIVVDADSQDIAAFIKKEV
jgi:hypothetical protein